MYAPPSHLFEEIYFASERQVGFWKPNIMPDHQGMVRTPGIKTVASSPLEELLPSGAWSVDCLKLPPPHVPGVQKENFHIYEEGTATFSGPSWRSANNNPRTASNLYLHPASYSMDGKRTNMNRINESYLFSSSLSEISTRKLRSAANDVLSHQRAYSAASCYEVEEPFVSTKEIEMQNIRNLLPDDDDLFSGMIDQLGFTARAHCSDDEGDFDLFSSGGGMELEGDNLLHACQGDSDSTVGILNGGGRSNWSHSNEHPYGEHPSRTLFVRNINSNVEDSELRILFEQYGDIRTLYTACKHRGFVIISYYDIRAAKNAMSTLQNKPLRRWNLDIHYSIPKGNYSEKYIDQGILAIFNLDSSVSNDKLHQVFGSFGEIKEVFKPTRKYYHQFIEYYDIRAAEAAFRALNMSSVAGKQIKLELSHLGGARERLMQQCSPELVQDKLSLYQSPIGNSSAECIATASPGAMKPSCIDDGSTHGSHSASGMTCAKNAFSQDNFTVPKSLPSLVRVASVCNPFGLRELGHSMDLGQLDLAGAAIGPEKVEVINNSHINIVDPNGQQTECYGGVFGSSGTGSCPLHGHCLVWNNSNSFQHYPPSPMIWPNSPLMVNSVHAHCTQKLPGLSRAPPHVLNTVTPMHHHHIRSAPTFNLRHASMGESPEALGFHLDSPGSVGFPTSSPLHLSKVASHISQVGRNCMDMSANSALCSPQHRCKNAASSTPSSFGIPNERISNLSHRRKEADSCHADKKYELDVDRVLCGEDRRTTLMIKNIPNKYTSKMLLAVIDEQHRGTYDFIYLPIDFKNNCNMGYAFINMIDPLHILRFHKAFNGKKWEKFNSEKVASLAYARIQGKAALIAHFQNSSLMSEDKRCRPILFCTGGPNAGDQEPFPMGCSVRSRPSKLQINFNESPSSPAKVQIEQAANPRLILREPMSDLPKSC